MTDRTPERYQAAGQAWTGLGHLRRVAPWRTGRSPALAAAACLLQFFIAGAAWAIDILPRDYFPLPSGTNATAFYYEFSQSNLLNVARGETFKSNTDLQVNLGVYRQVYYGDIGGRAWGLQLLVPFGGESGQILGSKLDGSSGAGDISLATGISFLPHPEPTRNLGVTLYVSLPTGSYSPVRTLNLGANRWSFDTQAGYTQAIGDKFWFDAAADVITYTDNGDVGLYGATLRQRPTFQGQVWFSYVPDLASLVSVGYAGQLGGGQSVAGTDTGVKTESHQIRLSYIRFLTARFQVAGSVAHDIAVTGGFQQAVVVLLRAAFLF